MGPDNGIFWPVLNSNHKAKVIHLTEDNYFLPKISHTFHGRDIFAPVAAHLAAGLPLSELGPVVERQTLVSGVVPRCRFSPDGCIEGMVVAVDRFGNLMTNIDAATIDGLNRRLAGKAVVVELAGKPIGGIEAFYDRVAEHAPLALIGSRGLLEISVNGGSARRILNAGRRDGVRVRPA